MHKRQLKKQQQNFTLSIINAALIIILIVPLSLFTGCSPDEDITLPTPYSEPIDIPTQDEILPYEEPPELPEPQILRFGATEINGNFNPIMSSNIYDNYITSLIFEPLIISDHQGLPIPYLATWEISNNNLTYTFTLKDGITFSDGAPLTTADVAFTFKTMAHSYYTGPRSYSVSHWLGYDEFKAGVTNEFAAIEILGEKTIAFHMQEGTANPANIWSFAYGIMPKHIYDFDNWDEFLGMLSTPIGSGKFIFDQWVSNEFVSLSRNEYYWNYSEFPEIDGILFLEISEENLLSAFENDEIDIARPLSDKNNYSVFSALPTAQVITVLDNGYQFLQFNTLRPQLNDYRVRQALVYAFDRQAYIDVQLGALGSVGMAPISPASWAFPTRGINDYAFNPDRARELMTEAGWEPGDDGILTRNGIRMELDWLVYTDVPWPAVIAELAYDSWGQIGVALNIIHMDFDTVAAGTMNAEPGEKDFDIFTMGFRLGIDPDPSGGLYDYSAFIAGGLNASGYFSERAQELLDLGITTFDQSERAAIYQEWSEIMTQSLPTVIIAYRYTLWVVSDRVQSIDISTFRQWHYNISNVTLI